MLIHRNNSLEKVRPDEKKKCHARIALCSFYLK